jgi:hypothetical protein
MKIVKECDEFCTFSAQFEPPFAVQKNDNLRSFNLVPKLVQDAGLNTHCGQFHRSHQKIDRTKPPSRRKLRRSVFHHLFGTHDQLICDRILLDNVLRRARSLSDMALHVHPMSLEEQSKD